MKTLLFLLFLIIGKYTFQQPDILYINDQEVQLRFIFPLEKLNFNKRPFGYTRETAPTSACWRGYTANWTIIDEKLYLKSINRCYGDDNKPHTLDLSTFFQSNNLDYDLENDLIFANWFTGELPIKSEHGELYLNSNKSTKTILNKDSDIANIRKGIVIGYRTPK